MLHCPHHCFAHLHMSSSTMTSYNEKVAYGMSSNDSLLSPADPWWCLRLQMVSGFGWGGNRLTKRGRSLGKDIPNQSRRLVCKSNQCFSTNSNSKVQCPLGQKWPDPYRRAKLLWLPAQPRRRSWEGDGNWPCHKGEGDDWRGDKDKEERRLDTQCDADRHQCSPSKYHLKSKSAKSSKGYFSGNCDTGVLGPQQDLGRARDPREYWCSPWVEHVSLPVSPN